MADISAIRSALKTRLATMLGNNGQASDYWLAAPTPPCLQVVGISADYDNTFGRGSDVLTATIEALAQDNDIAGQQQIDDWCDTSGATSVKAAIETERPSQVTLGGLVSSCRVTGATRPRITQLPNGTDVWSVEFTVEIIT